MITLSARINLLEGKNGALKVPSITNSKNNISSKIEGILGVKTQGSNPFLLGVSKLGDKSTFSNSENYYIGDISANDYGVFESPYEFAIEGENISNITIVFDKYNDRHPNSINVDGKEYVDDDSTFTISLENSNSHTITINNWNTPNYPLVIQGIFVELVIEIDKRNMQAINVKGMDRADINKPSWGIYSNTGNIEFVDYDGEVEDYAYNLLLKEGIIVNVYIKDTLSKKSQLVASMQTSQWDYDNDNRSVSVSIKDDLEEWQNIEVEEISFDFVEQQHSYREYYNYLWEKTPSKFNMLSFEELDNITKDIIQNTYTPYKILYKSNLWNEWHKFCNALGLNIYKKVVGQVSRTICSYEYR